MTTLNRVVTRGLTKAGRIAEITTKVIDKPGSLIQVLQVVSDCGANILSVNHEREDKDSDVGACIVSMVLETRNAEHVAQIEEAMESKGYSLLSK